MGNFASCQRTDMREYLVTELITHCKEIYADPEDLLPIAEFLTHFPETLSLLKTVGQEEAQLAGKDLSIYFAHSIDRLAKQVDSLRSNIERQSLASAVVTRILSEIGAHIGRLSLDGVEESDTDKLEWGQYSVL
jgi:hypothetical protein